MPDGTYVSMPLAEYERLKHIKDFQLLECFNRLNFVMDNYKGNFTNVLRSFEEFKREMTRDYYFNFNIV